ncbi:hypothetical protein ACFGVS_23705 [Mucilaginibacter sp. AW1-7]|uniref:hypothetical protein n=1 Tax=Mucilaginibacter sp. AW1-7 TaxID=3349874 RepID=UPI003F73F6CF
MKFYTYTEFLPQMQEFFKCYEPLGFIGIENLAPVSLKYPKERECRYCGQAWPQVTFDQDAHIISQLLGKNNLLCDYECDNCNALFSKYESAFVNWLGITRTIVGTRNRKNNIPEFKSGSGKIVAANEELLNRKGTKITSVFENDNAIVIDPKEGTTTITYLKRSYIPFNVFRILLKIAFASLQEDELKDYQKVLEVLVNPKPHPEFLRFAHVLCFHLPLEQQAKSPYGFIFRKKEPLARNPKHFFIFYYANQVFSYPLPFSLPDLQNGCYTKIECIFPPPLFLEPTMPQSIVSATMKAMGGLESVKDDQEIVGFQFDPEDLKNVVSIDPITGQIKDTTFDPTSIVSVFLMDDGNEINWTPPE